MKKFLFTLITLMVMAVTASAQTVYIATGSGAVAYHKSKDCSYLANSANVKSVSTTEAKNLGRHACSRCYGSEASAASKKTVTKKPATTEKKATTTTAKKSAPERDEKGRFVKKADIEKKEAKKATTKKAAEKKATTTTAKKSAPERDEKGRFVKKADTEKKEAKKTTTKKAAEKKAAEKKTTKKAA